MILRLEKCRLALFQIVQKQLANLEGPCHCRVGAKEQSRLPFLIAIPFEDLVVSLCSFNDCLMGRFDENPVVILTGTTRVPGLFRKSATCLPAKCWNSSGLGL